MLGLGIPEMVLIMVAALLIFGPKKLPEIGQSVGKALREFKKGMNDLKDNFDNVLPEDDLLSAKTPAESIKAPLINSGSENSDSAPITVQAPQAVAAPSQSEDARAAVGPSSASNSDDSVKL